MKKTNTYKMIVVSMETYNLLKNIQDNFKINTGGKIALGQIIHSLIPKNDGIK